MQEATEHPENSDSNCLFCQWIRAGKAVETLGTVTAFNDGYPVTADHLLIVPLRPTADWFSMTNREIRDSDTLIRALVERIRPRDHWSPGLISGRTSVHRPDRPCFMPIYI